MTCATWVLAFSTIGLMLATIGLLLCTWRYTKATNRMVRSTEQYTTISEKLLRTEMLTFVDKILLSVYPSSADADNARKDAIFDYGQGQSGNILKDKEEVGKKELRLAYRKLYEELLDSVLGEEATERN